MLTLVEPISVLSELAEGPKYRRRGSAVGQTHRPRRGELYFGTAPLARLIFGLFFFFLILFSGNRQIPGLATGAVGHSLLYSRR